MAGKGSEVPRTFKKVSVVSRRNASEIKKDLVDQGFELVEVDPDFVLCYGGDGTVLYAERKFPEVPKLIIKTSRACRKYDYKLKDLNALLAKINKGNYCLHSEMKLEAIAKGERLVCLNDIQVHLKLPIYAVRFSLSVDGKEFNDLIGDGVIVAPPFGSTAYYRATGGEPFKKGIGISFNNLHYKKVDSLVASEASVVNLTVTRGPAWLLADNNEDFIELTAGDSVTIKKSVSVANFIYFS